MRYADGPTVEVDVHVAAPPARVWTLVSDINLPGRFSDEFVDGEWVDRTSPAVGARFKGRNWHPQIGTWETTSVVIDYQPERVFAWSVSDADTPAATWRFELAPEGDGTRLRQWAQLGPGPSGISYEIELSPDREEEIVERRLGEHRVNMERVVNGIKELAESD